MLHKRLGGIRGRRLLLFAPFHFCFLFFMLYDNPPDNTNTQGEARRSRLCASPSSPTPVHERLIIIAHSVQHPNSGRFPLDFPDSYSRFHVRAQVVHTLLQHTVFIQDACEPKKLGRGGRVKKVDGRVQTRNARLVAGGGLLGGVGHVFEKEARPCAAHIDFPAQESGRSVEWGHHQHLHPADPAGLLIP